jgi:membrane-associated phospholipid phosphatase
MIEAMHAGGTHATFKGTARRHAPPRSPSHRAPPRGSRELALFVLAYLAYFGIRAATEGHVTTAVTNAWRIFDTERVLGINWEAPIQRVIEGRDALLDVANGMYIWGHWPLLIVGGVLLFCFSRRDYVRLRNAVLLSGAIGLVVFGLFPVAPPRLAGVGLVDTVTLHAPMYRDVLPPSLVNEYAAMPSFHAGWNLLLGIVVWRASRHVLLRVFAVVMPAAMAVAVVATGNHYVVDVIAGAAIVVATVAVLDRLERRRRFVDSMG